MRHLRQSDKMKQEIKTKQEREQALYNHYSTYKNTIDFNKYPLFNSVFSKEHKDKITKSKELYLFYKTRLKNITFDIDNIKNYEIPINNYSKVLYEQDKTLYKIINKKPRYKDISLFQLLKLFQKEHKISKVLFKKSIKIIKEIPIIKQHNEITLYLSYFDKSHKREFKKIPQLSNKVLLLVNSYYKTIKSHNNKTSVSALIRQQDNRTRLNFNGYSVLIKQRYSRIIENHNINQENNNYSKDRLKLIYSLIEKEHKTKLTQDNKII